MEVAQLLRLEEICFNICQILVICDALENQTHSLQKCNGCVFVFSGFVSRHDQASLIRFCSWTCVQTQDARFLLALKTTASGSE
jgi:hypothetical protein